MIIISAVCEIYLNVSKNLFCINFRHLNLPVKDSFGTKFSFYSEVLLLLDTKCCTFVKITLESLFNKVPGLKFVTLLKKRPTQVFSCEICETFKNTYFPRTFPVAASVFLINMQIFKKTFFYESLPLKLPAAFPEIFFENMLVCSTNVLLINVLFLFKRT